MDEVRFCKGLTIGSALLLAFALILGTATGRHVADESAAARERAAGASSPSVPPALRSSEDPPQPAGDATFQDGQALAGEPVNALREGYSAYRMRGILGRVGVGEGTLYVENRNRFEWRDVRVVLDEETTHEIGSIPPAAVRRIPIDARPRDVRVSAAGLDDSRAAVLAFTADETGAHERDK